MTILMSCFDACLLSLVQTFAKMPPCRGSKRHIYISYFNDNSEGRWHQQYIFL